MKQIYFDSDEDITAIINKLESYESNKIALIPPKRSTTLQSVVNLKLLQKAAKAKDNELVVITRDPLILNIASQLHILTAPNLATEPEVPQPKESRGELPSAVIEDSEASEKDFTNADEAAESVEEQGETADKKHEKPLSAQKDNKDKKVPDFNRFKKYLLLGLLGVLLLGGFLWWAIFVAPNATVRIEGITQDVSATTDFTLDPEADESDPEQRNLAADVRQEGRTLSTTFEPSGTKTVGEKATGEVTITNCRTTEITIESGTNLTAANSSIYRAQNTKTIKPSNRTPPFGVEDCEEDEYAVIQVEAAEIGEEYNIGPTDYTVEGYDQNSVYSIGSTNMTGGESEEVTVVTDSDVQQARQQLLKEERSSVRESLRNQFNEGQYIVDASFAEDVTEISSEPPTGSQVDDNARLILQVTYTLLAVPQEDMEALLEHAYQQEVEDGEELGVIENGLDEAKFERTGENLSFSLQAEGVMGPDIPEEELKNQIAGKAYKETIEELEAKPNVTTVEVHLSPFWVTSVPGDPGKIEVEFKVAEPDAQDNTGD